MFSSPDPALPLAKLSMICACASTCKTLGHSGGHEIDVAINSHVRFDMLELCTCCQVGERQKGSDSNATRICEPNKMGTSAIATWETWLFLVNLEIVCMFVPI
jgi:hypothetical protein